MSETPPGAGTKKKRSSLRWVYRILGAFVLIVVLLIVFLPTILSSDFVVDKVREGVRDASGGLAHFGELELGWGSFTLTGLRVDQPPEPGMPEGPALSLDRASGSFSLWSFVFGGVIDVDVHAEAPMLHVHRTKDGRNNLQAIQKHMKARVETRGPGPDQPRQEPRTGEEPLPLELDVRIEKGRIVLTDDMLGVERRIEDLLLHVGNQGPGAPVQLKLRGRIAGEGGQDGEFTVTANGALAAQAPERVDLSTTHIDLAHWAPLVNGFVEEPFERLEGVVNGDLAAQLQHGGDAWRVTGNLRIDQPRFVGGPLGAGRGLVAEAWSIAPQFLYDAKTRDTSLEGTRVDLGFATLLGLSPRRAKELMPESALEPGKRLVPIGLELKVDLARLATQPGLLPEGEGWSGTLQQEFAAVIDPSVPPTELAVLPFRLVCQLQELAVPAALLPEGAKAPDSSQFEFHGKFEPNTLSLAPSELTLRSPGIEADGTVGLGAERQVSGKLELRFQPENASWVRALLPKGLELSGNSRVTVDVGGRIGADEEPLTAKGALSASTVRYLGNELSELASEFEWTQGNALVVRTPTPAKLNGGPIALSATLDRGEQQRIGFRLQWSGGLAKYGLTPALRYAFPLLAGLPTEDVDRMANIDFGATTSITLEANGPLPGAAQSFADVYRQWTGKGELQLADGAVTPAAELAQILKFAGSGGSGRIQFDAVQGEIAIREGRLHVDDLQIGGKDGKVTISGSTSLLGDLRHKIDFTGWLAQHRDGQRVLKALGDQRVVAQLGGSLLSPELKVEDFAKKIIEGGLENAVEGFLKGLGEGKKPEDALKDLLKGLGGKDKK